MSACRPNRNQVKLSAIYVFRKLWHRRRFLKVFWPMWNYNSYLFIRRWNLNSLRIVISTEFILKINFKFAEQKSTYGDGFNTILLPARKSAKKQYYMTDNSSNRLTWQNVKPCCWFCPSSHRVPCLAQYSFFFRNTDGVHPIWKVFIWLHPNF